MPELPEVETLRRHLEPELTGATLLDINVLRKQNFLGELKSYDALLNHRIVSLSRKGKFLIFNFDNDLSLLSHLRMEGKWFFKAKDAPITKHDIAVFKLDRGNLVYNDTRKFGIIALKTKENLLTTEPLSKLAPEPWDLKIEDFYVGLRKRNGMIKEVLLDQTLIAGLGNIYADEVLYKSKINPRKLSNTMTTADASAMLENAKITLKEAITHNGSTIHSYLFAENQKGEMQELLLAYGREGQPCHRCGAPMRKIFIGGRGTTYCPFCQKEENRPLVYAITGPIASGKSAASKLLKEKGFKVLDADKIVASLYEDKEVIKKLQTLFPNSIKKNKVDRLLLTKEIMDKKKKEVLNNLIHPLVYERMLSEIKKSKREKILLDIPLWKGSKLEDETDFLIYIEADEPHQIERLLARGKDPELSLKVNAGYPKAYLKKKASLILDGNGSEEDLAKQIEACPYL